MPRTVSSTFPSAAPRGAGGNRASGASYRTTAAETRELRRRQRAAYHQMRRAFGLVPEPLSLFEPVPSLLLTGWACLRESLVCGTVPRRYKEALAVAISRGAECPYCVDAHSLLAAASGLGHSELQHLGSAEPAPADHDPQLAAYNAWAQGTFQRPQAPLAAPCSEEELPELIGIGLCFHYIHRLATILLGDSPLPGSGIPGVRSTLLRALPRPLGLAIRLLLGRQPQVGASLPLMPAPWAELPLRPEFDRLASRPNIQRAFSAFRHAAEAEVQPYLPAAPRRLLEAHLDAWDGAPLPLTSPALGELLTATDPMHHPALRLAFLTARAPHRVTPEMLQSFREVYSGKGPTVALLAWAASRVAFGMMGWWGAEGSASGTAARLG